MLCGFRYPPRRVGTGDDLRKAIVAGITVVHVNTELRVAWRHDLEQGLIKEPNAVVPYKILPFAVESGKSDSSRALEPF